MNPGLYERLLTASPAAAGRPPRSSAAVVPWRQDDRGNIEVYWVRRSPALRFMGGWHAFPGGGLSRADAEVALDAPPAGISADGSSLPPTSGDGAGKLGPDLAPGIAVCAVRELFEETGLLLATGGSTTASKPDRKRLRAARRRLLAGADFAALAGEEGWTLSAASLRFAGRWLTPPLGPLRFDNRFFLLEWPRERRPQPEILAGPGGGELDDGEWIAPARALERWQRAEVLAAPPILHLLRVLAEDGPQRGLPRLVDPRESRLGDLLRIELRPGVILLPLRTPTLPPATHTNTFLLGRREAVLIDPASPHETEIERLGRALAAARDRGLEISAIWLTHHHPDHVGAVEAMRRRLAVPVCAHRQSAGPLERLGIRVDRQLEDGQRIELAGDPPFPVRVLHTPGHTRGHLCFLDETHGSLIAGDLISALSTIVIDPPEGDMEAYLRSLERMIELAPKTLFPAHGPAVPAAVDKLEEFLAHRLEREEQVLAVWHDGRQSAAEMVPVIYPEVPAALHGIAARQVEAHLDRLRSTGRIAE